MNICVCVVQITLYCQAILPIHGEDLGSSGQTCVLAMWCGTLQCHVAIVHCIRGMMIMLLWRPDVCSVVLDGMDHLCVVCAWLMILVSAVLLTDGDSQEVECHLCPGHPLSFSRGESFTELTSIAAYCYLHCGTH